MDRNQALSGGTAGGGLSGWGGVGVVREKEYHYFLCNSVRKSPQFLEKAARFPGGDKSIESCRVSGCGSESNILSSVFGGGGPRKTATIPSKPRFSARGFGHSGELNWTRPVATICMSAYSVLTIWVKIITLHNFIYCFTFISPIMKELFTLQNWFQIISSVM